ncbi:MAG TPA: divalent-cation tolerance protein CutA [Candidatus Methanoperedenaceae archaeon]|nr:divalent-cation tolerance protein CutA [Candidatus Methanoperedenaceae archaeon]
MFVFVYITTGTAEEAKTIARALVQERIAACANIFPVSSVYRWKGSVEEADETGMIVKTTDAKLGELEKRVKELHSYQVPCIISMGIGGGSKEYLDWIGESTMKDSDDVQ